MSGTEHNVKPGRDGRRSKHVTAIVALLVGIVIGAGSTELANIIRDRRLATLFEARLRCRSLAEAYKKSKSNEFTTSFVHLSGFSRSRDSCVATMSSASGSLWTYKVVDTLTGQTLFSDQCSEKGTESDPTWCGNGRDVKLRQEMDRAFENIVK